MARICYILISFLIALPAFAGASSSRVINDDFVENLQCLNLSVDSIYDAAVPWAFSWSRRILTANNDLESEVGGYGDCWSLSRWQRLNLLLGRQSSAYVQYDDRIISNLIRGTEEADDSVMVTRVGTRRTAEVPLNRYRVFAFPELPIGKGNWIMDRVDLFRKNLLSDRRFHASRSYFKDLHAYQRSQFYRLQNLKFIFSKPSALSTERDLVQITKLANRNRLPLVILRFARLSQHVVAVKKVKRIGPNEWHFDVIDPDFPGDDGAHLQVVREKGEWVITYHIYLGEKKAEIFLTGEDERAKIDDALLSHYRMRCRATAAD